MDNTVVNAIVAASALVIGAAVTGFASGYIAKQKIREVEITY